MSIFKFKFNMDHWIAVKTAREEAGIPSNREENRYITDSPLLGRKVVCSDSDKEY